MICCSDLLFLHVPRTAGMSMTRSLIDVLPRPTWYVRPPTRFGSQQAREGVIEVNGPRHATLPEAREIVSGFGFDLNDFPMILVGIRNPYDLEVSRFAHLQKGLPHQRGRDAILAREGSFEQFARESPPHASRPLEAYFLLDGEVPETLRLIRFENLERDFAAALEAIGIAGATLPRAVNASSHEDFMRYYTPGAEAAVFQKYKWVFDAGYYPRLSIEDHGA